MKRISVELWRFCSSLKLGIALIAVLVIGSLPAAFIVQNQSPEYYLDAYPVAVAYAILATGYSSFFSSPFFIALLSVFWINLLCCTLKRFAGQVRMKTNRRFGPDILHAGLLLVILGGGVSAVTRQEAAAYAYPGEAFQLPDGSLIIIDSVAKDTYDDGRPLQWTTSGRIELPGRMDAVPFSCSVNSPFRIRTYTMYQYDFSDNGNGRYLTGIMVVTGRGRFLVLTGFFIVSIGVIASFAVPRRKRS